MHRHEMQQSNIYLGIYIIEYYFFWKNQGVTIPLLNPPPSSMALKPLTPVLNPRPPLPGAPPAPYKRRAPSPSSFPLSPCLSNPLTEHRRRRAFTVVARPPRRHPSPGEALAELPGHSSLCCAPAGELWRIGAAGGRAPVSAPPRPGPPLSVPPSVQFCRFCT
jgi:hypothetical protein